MTRPLQWVLPTTQRRTLDELTRELDLSHGDRKAKQSAFLTMLTLSGLIASAGVLGDSTATVIGAMIIAPLSTPIMGIALGIVQQRRTGGAWAVSAGVLLVVLTGLAFSSVLPGSYDLASNTQVSSRTSPGLLDMVAASATGLAGAIALARRDVAAVLPGVAIAISLVPPLAVAGICLGFGEAFMALGALLLFASNLLALVMTGTLVFAVLGYSSTAEGLATRARRRAQVTLAVLIGIVLLPLGLNTAATYYLGVWHEAVEEVAEEWIAVTPQARVVSVDTSVLLFVINVETPRRLPPTDDLLRRLEGRVPGFAEIVVATTVGRRIVVGPVDQASAGPASQVSPLAVR